MPTQALIFAASDSTPWQSVSPLLEMLGASVLIYLTAKVTAISKRIRDAAGKHRPIEAVHHDDLEISVILDRAMSRLGAKRVYLSQYHNGDYYDSGSAIQRVSRTHERVRPGVAYQQEQVRGILTSSLPEETTLILKDGPSWTPVNALKESKFRWLCDGGGTVSVARCAVRGATVVFACPTADVANFNVDNISLLTGGTCVIPRSRADFDGDAEPPGLASLCDDARRIGQILASAAGEKSRP